LAFDEPTIRTVECCSSARVGVDDQEQVEGVDGVGVDLVSFAGDREHHLQEVLGILEMVLRIK